MLKPTLSFEDQLTLLKSRGMLIGDEAFALKYLSENSYYHLNIYFKHFQFRSGFVDERGSDEYIFKQGVTFDHIVRVHENDKQLQILILKAIMPIELKLRTIISYFMGSSAGSGCFYIKNDRKIYPNLEKIEKLRGRFEEIIDFSGSNGIVQHHTLKYARKFPLFAIFELTSFSFMIDYFESLSFSYQDKMANRFFRQPDSRALKNWMRCLNDLRNICAHQNFLFTRLFNVHPLFINDSPLYGSNRLTLFAYLIVLGYMSNEKDWQVFIRELIEEDNKRNFLKEKSYGFGADWESRLNNVPHIFNPN